jgi:1-deoxy-D-xylulose-5-phosphate reductoisomerase
MNSRPTTGQAQAEHRPVRVVLLGATGSIGVSACSCLRRLGERFRLIGASAYGNITGLQRCVRDFRVETVCIADESAAAGATASFGDRVRLVCGHAGLEEMASELDYDVLLNALVGAVGLRPTIAALKRGKRVALANKESLVIGGDCIGAIIQRGSGEIIPVDSEHSAIFQCLKGEDLRTVESLILTASGGPFHNLPPDRFEAITPACALAHPTWRMGKKITIDSATLMNKGFEVIEAHHLFHISYEKVRVWIHPQSIVHSMVEFHDGAIVAQMGLPDMELPIQYALTYPERCKLSSPRLNLPAAGPLTFGEPDTSRFPCLRLAIEAGRRGGTAPVALNAANEVAVQLFLDGKIAYTAIAPMIERVLEKHNACDAESVGVIEEADRSVRAQLLRDFCGIYQ